MPFKRPNWPPHIEYFNPELCVQNFSDDASLHSENEEMMVDTAVAHRQPKFEKKNPATVIEHFNPIRLQPRLVPTAVEAEYAPSPPKQESKRRKISGSSKPQKLHPAKEENTKTSSSAGRNPREVQVLSENGELLHLFQSCSEAGRRMNITRTRISRGKIAPMISSQSFYLSVQPSAER